MGYQRKGWNDLSDAYRKRLMRGGITEADYGKGESLTRARGKRKKGDAKEVLPKGVSSGSYAYWNRKRISCGVTDADWKELLESVEWESIKDIFRWKDYAFRTRMRSVGSKNGIATVENGRISPPPIKYKKGYGLDAKKRPMGRMARLKNSEGKVNSMFYYGDKVR